MGTRVGRGSRRELAVAHGRPEPTWRRVVRDLLSLAFVVGAVVAGIRAGRATDDVGLGIGVGFAVCFVGAVLISRTVIAPDQKPAPRWAVVLSLVTSPLVIAAAVIELRADEHPVGDLRLFCGVAGLLFGLDQWAQRGRLRRRVATAEAARRRAERDERFPIVPAAVLATFAPEPSAEPDVARRPAPEPDAQPEPGPGAQPEPPAAAGPAAADEAPAADASAAEVRHLHVVPDVADDERGDEEMLPPHRW